LQIVTALNARMFLLRGDWPAACRRYEDLLGAELSRQGDPSSEEGLARHFLEYGRALAGGRLPERALAVWERGLRCPDYAGNWFWKQQIQQALRGYPRGVSLLFGQPSIAPRAVIPDRAKHDGQRATPTDGHGRVETWRCGVRDRREHDLPDGLRVLVAGGHAVERQAVLRFCRELGKALMLIERATEGTPVVVMTGGRGEQGAADRELVLGAREALGAAREDELPRRVVTFPSPDQSALSEPFVGTHVQPTRGTRQARRFAMTVAADVVVMVNGGHGTSEQATLSMALDRLCIPLPFTGGRALEVWNSRDGDVLRRRLALSTGVRTEWEAMAEPPMDRERLAELAGQVAELVVAAAELPCFVSMPYEERAKQRYEDTILPAIKSAGMRAVRSDHGLESGSVTEEMRVELRNAAAVCALLTDVRYVRSADDLEPVPSVNPNVMYEIGYAHALGKPTFLLAENADGIPFNVEVDRILTMSGPGSATARSQLIGMLRNARHKLDAAEADSAYEATARPPSA
jgi:hypothetical protein